MPVVQLLQPILVLFILLFTGFLATRYRIISSEFREGLSRLILDITLPLLILSSLMKLDLTPEILRGSFLVLALAYGSLFLMLLIGFGISGLLKMERPQARVHALQTMLGNVVFIGYPLMNELFPGGEGLLYAALYHFANNSTMWTLGVYLLSREKNHNLFANLKNLLNPNTLALLTGFLLMSLRVRMPSLLDASLGGLGRTSIFLSMIYVGSLLASYRRPRIFSRLSSWLLFATKMLVFPLILLFLLLPLASGPAPLMNHVALSVLVMQSAMPCMAVFVVIARKYKADENLAVDNVLLTTLLSLLSLPLMYYLLRLVLEGAG